MKHGFLIYLLFAFCLATNGQETRNILTGDYTELTDTKPVDKEAWDKQPGKTSTQLGINRRKIQQAECSFGE